MQTLIDPFELASRAPRQRPAAATAAPTDGDAGVRAGRPADPQATNKTDPSDPWTKVRWWCSED